MIEEVVAAYIRDCRPDALRKCGAFAELHGLVEREIGSMRGIGALTVYDVAHRIGAFLGKPPGLVYLHAGTRERFRSRPQRGDASFRSLARAFRGSHAR